MRKFKAWDKTNKKWIDDFLIDEKGTIACIPDMVEDVVLNIDWQNITIIQYTGLKDKNGKEIYEGDIINWIDREYKQDEIGVVVFIDGTFKLKHPMCYQKDYDRGYDEMITFWKDGIHDWRSIENNYFDFVIIGNIYENPELIK